MDARISNEIGHTMKYWYKDFSQDINDREQISIFPVNFNTNENDNQCFPFKT
jgi:hypothetical protein